MSKITRDTLVEDVIKAIVPSPLNLPDGWWRWNNIQEAFKILAKERIDNKPDFPDGKFNGRGIVICAGGRKLFTCGYVCARILRQLGCLLPIQFWHFSEEIDNVMKKIVEPLNVECVDVGPYRKQYKPRVLHGWELKPFAMIHSKFEEILLLDADNVPVKDPTFLFECDQYKETKALFWPDYGKLARSREIWGIFETNYDDYPDQHEFESGQIVVDKKRHWNALDLSMFMNEYSDYYYKFIHGDKCTFELAWKRLREPFFLIKKPIHPLDATMCQHSPIDGSRLFQHRNLDKWVIENNNRRIHDFWNEGVCKTFIGELQTMWNGNPFKPDGATITDGEVKFVVENISGQTFIYHRVGYDKRNLQFLPGGSIGAGRDRCEQKWEVNRNGDDIILTITGNNGPTCHLKKIEGIWRGSWVTHEKMPVELYSERKLVKVI